MTDRWLVKVRGEFSAAHALRRYEGKCERLHGHNFSVEICAGGSELDPDTGLLLDFKVLKAALRRALEELDHSVINDLPPFLVENPSSENIAKYLWERLETLLAEDPRASRAALEYVEVSEKAAQSARYCRLK